MPGDEQKDYMRMNKTENHAARSPIITCTDNSNSQTTK